MEENKHLEKGNNLARILVLGQTNQEADDFIRFLLIPKSIEQISPPNCTLEFTSSSFDSFASTTVQELTRYLVVLSLFDRKKSNQLDVIRSLVSERIWNIAPFVFHIVVCIDLEGSDDTTYNIGEIVAHVTKLSFPGLYTLRRTIRFYIESICNDVQVDFTGYSQVQQLLNSSPSKLELTAFESSFYSPLPSTVEVIAECLYPGLTSIYDENEEKIRQQLNQVRGTLEALIYETKLSNDDAIEDDYDELPVCDDGIYSDMLSELSTQSKPMDTNISVDAKDCISIKVRLSKNGPELELVDDLSKNPLMLAHEFVKANTVNTNRSASERRVLRKACESLSKAVIQARLNKTNANRSEGTMENDNVVGILRVQFMKYDSGDILLSIRRSDIQPCMDKGSNERRQVSERIVDRFLMDTLIETSEERKKGLVMSMTNEQKSRLILAVDDTIEQILKSNS